MKHVMKLALVVCMLLVTMGCEKKRTSASADNIFEDAVRINPRVTSKYFKTDENGATRDGRTLRGVVERVVIRFDTSNAALDTTVVFRDLIDSTVSRKPVFIPIQDVESISKIFPSVMAGENGGINVFESFNVTKQIPVLRKVPVDSIIPNVSKPFKEDCNCEPFDLTADISLRLRCGDRDYSRFFAAALGRASAYTDGSAIVNTGRINLGIDALAGYRFGETKQWMLGLTYSTGLATVDAGSIIPAVTSIDTMVTEMRPLLLLTGRYYLSPVRNRTNSGPSSYFGVDLSTDPNRPANASPSNDQPSNETWVESLFGCIKPYTYAELGAALDTKTQAALSMSLSGPSCNECMVSLMQAKARGDVNLDWSLPVSFGLGVGVDIPVSKKLDIEVDLGYRNVAVGDSYQLLGFTNVPDTRRISSFQLRIGVAY
ncbi:MAG: hypothetical protein FJ211_05655 [Ignavibacteria bacterium]|nr:hypothetical protein [Ignavibacteria bacterium]